jgi:FK506-binding protein 4/5
MAMPNEEASKIIFGSNFSSGLDITCDKDGGVLKTVLRHGIGEEHPLNGDTVYLHYMGHFEDGTVFDSSRAGNEKFQFVMGNGT